jgi:glycosyltransferase involved in cell wall biosynthesis
VPAFLGRADIGLHLTEIAEEVHSLAILEMLAASLPVVSQPRGCLPELVTDGRNGFLAEDEGAIASRLEQLIEDAELRRRFGVRSREVARRYDVQLFAARYTALVDRVARRSGRSSSACLASGGSRRAGGHDGAVCERVAAGTPIYPQEEVNDER